MNEARRIEVRLKTALKKNYPNKTFYIDRDGDCGICVYLIKKRRFWLKNKKIQLAEWRNLKYWCNTREALILNIRNVKLRNIIEEACFDVPPSRHLVYNELISYLQRYHLKEDLIIEVVKDWMYGRENDCFRLDGGL